MEDLTLDRTSGPGSSLRNGKQVARRSDDIWFLTLDREERVSGKTAVILRTSRTPTLLGADEFNEPIVLAGNLGVPVLSPRVGAADQGCILVDDRDVLHVAWRMRQSGEVWYAQCPVNGAGFDNTLRVADNWRHADGVTVGPERVDQEGLGPSSLGDMALDKDGRICIAYSQGQPGGRRVYFVGFDGAWSRQAVTEKWDLGDPVVDVDEAGVIHLAYGPGPEYRTKFVTTFGRYQRGFLKDPAGTAHRYGIYHTQSSDGVAWTRADGRTPGSDLVGFSGDHPSILVWQGRVVIAFMGGGNWPGMADRILYAYFDGCEWHTHINFSPVDPDTAEAPTLFMDRYGQPRLVYADMTRHHIFMSRWMGNGFAKPQEIRWAWEMYPTLAVEKRMPPDADEFGLLMMTGEGEVRFCRVEVPAIQTQEGKRVLFLDLWEMNEMVHLDLVVNTAKKEGANPVLRGDPDSWDSQASCYGTVLYDEGVFKMWYTARSRDHNFAGVCYAISRDGVHWEKPNLGIHEYNGSKENNICIVGQVPASFEPIRGGGMTPNPSVFKDPKEPDPNKRYKMVLNSQVINDVKLFGLMMHSPDGIHWTPYVSDPDLHTPTRFMLTEGVLHLMEMNGLFYDEKEPNEKRRWKIYGQFAGRRGQEEVRCGGLAYSPDGLDWTADWDHPVLDPRGGSEAGDHLMVVWPYRDYYIGVPDCWHESRALDNELTVSRDGYHFTRVADGQKILPRGEGAEWDAQFVSKANTIVTTDDEILIYYAGTRRPSLLGHPSAVYVIGAGRGHANTGLARVPVDAWTYLRVKPEHREGYVSTVPIALSEGSALDLVVKADHLRAGQDFILVELIDEQSGRPVPGFSAQDCTPIVSDGDAIRVRWAGGRFSDVGAKQVRVRFVLHGDGTRFYCFGFES